MSTWRAMTVKRPPEGWRYPCGVLALADGTASAVSLAGSRHCRLRGGCERGRDDVRGVGGAWQPRLYLSKAGRLVLKSAAAIGKPSTPTPLGSFFVTQRFVVSPTTGPYGPRALGISAFSDVLRTWTDGGPIGIHGTNEP